MFVSQHAFIFKGHDQPIIEGPFDLLRIQMDLDSTDPVLERSDSYWRSKFSSTNHLKLSVQFYNVDLLPLNKPSHLALG